MVVLGLGSNIGDRLGNLRMACRFLADVVLFPRVSAIYESAALLPEGAPPEWDIAYYNMALSGETALSPQELLHSIKRVECKLGRQDRGRWGPREIDIDILAYDAHIVTDSNLIIPHAGLLERDFALVPLADVQPGWRYPVAGDAQGKTASELAAGLRAQLARVEGVL